MVVGYCVVVYLCMVVGTASSCRLSTNYSMVTMTTVESLEYEHRKVVEAVPTLPAPVG